MKKLILALAFLIIVIACNKQDKTILPSPHYPESWGMVGTVSNDDFNATSLDAALIYYNNTGVYELNVNGWENTTDETIYLRYSGTSIQPGIIYKLDDVAGPERHKTWAFYQKGHKNIFYGKGYIYVHSITDSLVNGGYDFTTTEKKHVKGVFTIKPIYVTENDD